MSDTNNTFVEMTSLAFAPHLPIRYPTNAVIGIVDAPDELQRAVSALIDAGFWESEIEIAAGDAAAQAVHASTGRTGFTDLVLRIAQWLGVQDEELEYKSHYEEALRDGRFVVVVQTPSDGRKVKATELLRACGAHSLNFHGRLTIEELSPTSHA